MEEKAIKYAARILGVLACLVCVLLPYLPRLRMIDEETREAWLAQEAYADSLAEMQMLALGAGSSADAAGGQISICLPQGVDGSDIVIRNDYVTQTLRIEIPQADALYFDSYPITGSSSYIDKMSYTWEDGKGVAEIVTDRVYELDTTFDEDYYYISFLTPHEVYDKIVVIDAGHGGRAPGATKQGVMEKEIDLAIALQLKAIFEANEEKIGVYYTRTDDGNPTFEQRVQLANKSDADIFISIHNNSLKTNKMTATKGTQVMYAESSEQSQRLAQICLEEVTAALNSTNKGLVEGESIYIIRNSEAPVALIEVGFMTNQEELNLLKTEEYQRQAAEGIYAAILRALAEGY